jgi:iron(II)-dependent oxidoreductase
VASLSLGGERGGERIYPWGNEWDEAKCNTSELGLGNTCAVGMFPDGISPYGCLDMAGNICEWTISLVGTDWEKPDFKYPYDPTDGRENLEAADNYIRVLRGGTFSYDQNLARCACRSGTRPSGRYSDVGGFRGVVVSRTSG